LISLIWIVISGSINLTGATPIIANKLKLFLLDALDLIDILFNLIHILLNLVKETLTAHKSLTLLRYYFHFTILILLCLDLLSQLLIRIQ